MIGRGSRWWTALVLAAGGAGAGVSAALRHHLTDPTVYVSGGLGVWHSGTPYGVDVGHGHFGFTYPPFAALVFAAISWLSRGAAFVVLDLASIGAFAVIMSLCVPRIGARLREGDLLAAVGVAALLLCEPVVGVLRYAQVGLLLGALALYDLLVLRRGVLVGLTAAFKLVPGVFVLYLLACGRRREALTAAAVAIGATLLSAAVLPSASHHYWTSVLETGSGIGRLDIADNQSIRGVAERILGGHGGLLVWAVLALPVLAAGLWSARRVTLAGDEVLGVALAGITACLVSPVSWTHHWVFCVPLLVALWRIGSPGARYGAIGLWLLFAQGTFAGDSLLAPLLGYGYVLAAAGVLGVAATSPLAWFAPVNRPAPRRRGHRGLAPEVIVGSAVQGVGVEVCLHSPRGSAKPGVGTRLR